MPKRSPMPDRFWAKVVETESCWLWTACRNDSGYGRFMTRPGSLQYAHRIAWELHHRAEIPAELQIDHLCRVPQCVNPEHLEAVSPRVNTHRQPNGKVSRTHCPEGHAYDGDNLYLYTDKRGYTRRYCRTCSHATARAWRESHAS